MRAIIVFTSLLLACGIAPSAMSQNRGSDARAAELALSDDTLELRYAGAARVEEVPRSRFTAGILLSEDREFVLDGGLLIPSNQNLGPVSLRFGPRAYAALLRDENDDVLALSVGAEVRFDITRRSGLALVGHAYYAPDILTFGASDNLTDLSARAQINVSQQLLAFAGMRWFEFDLADGNSERTLMEEMFVGVGWQF